MMKTNLYLCGCTQYNIIPVEDMNVVKAIIKTFCKYSVLRPKSENG